jgi:acetylglutamate kinase
MRHPEDAGSLLPTINGESYRQLLADGTICGRMIPKMENAFNAIGNGVVKVIITKADAIDGTHGTHIIA